MGTVTLEVLFQTQILDELFGKEHNKPSIIYKDNFRIDLLNKEPANQSKNKKIDVRHLFIRDSIEAKKIEVCYVKSENNLADILTKI